MRKIQERNHIIKKFIVESDDDEEDDESGSGSGSAGNFFSYNSTLQSSCLFNSFSYKQ